MKAVSFYKFIFFNSMLFNHLHTELSCWDYARNLLIWIVWLHCTKVPDNLFIIDAIF